MAEVGPQWSEGHKCLKGEEDTFCRRLPGKMVCERRVNGKAGYLGHERVKRRCNSSKL